MYESEKSFRGEEPVYVSNPANANVIYNKGLLKMYDLYLLIGEEKLNLALKNLLAKYKYPKTPPTVLNLIQELKSVTDVKNYIAIVDLFMK